jgi:predicted HicB family RNase H-like nuclease
LEEPEHCRSFLLRLPVSIKKKAALLAMEEGISLNHFISLAVSNFVLKIERDREK